MGGRKGGQRPGPGWHIVLVSWNLYPHFIPLVLDGDLVASPALE